ncbi:MAG TPA: phosphoribosylglycinamide formyltransferase [Flavisolibacter sp.]|jgi:formyltetrahydrofolate-dependent phosphoribosylglycinamide formyltransferase|nr:phosphoribosylglycinamide formyltransferase [Flavisolibacter sp.]
MLKRLQQKWKVGATQLILIFCVFAITGTTTAYLSATARRWAGFTTDTFWLWKVLLSMVVLIFGYQVILLTVAFFFGQFSFFWNYEKKILTRVGWLRKPASAQSINMKQLTLFASGAGSNAREIIRYFKDSTTARVALIVCNKPGAGVIGIAEAEGIPVLMIEKERFFRGDGYVPELQRAGTDLIVLAGFLWKIPTALINAYPRAIINIHPALLPKFGGKGMYGQYVHESVLQAGELESGITIHYVDEHYDNGDVIFQTACPVLESDTPEQLAQRIHQLEHLHYPIVIRELVEKI